jgi:hypothetical protein
VKKGPLAVQSAQICIAGSVARSENQPTPALSPGQSTASGCESMRNCESSAGRARVWKSVAWPGMAIFFLSTSTTRAQDVAEAARQEQSRKVAQKNSPKHVYSEEDLKKKTILTPDDQAKVAARKQPDQQDPEKERERAQQPAQHQNAAVESLGDIARQYRIEKSAREAQATAKNNIRPLSYELPTVTTAAPKASVAPVIEITPLDRRPNFPEVTRSERPSRLSEGNDARARVSPFQPRPLAVAPPPASMSARPSTPLWCRTQLHR